MNVAILDIGGELSSSLSIGFKAPGSPQVSLHADVPPKLHDLLVAGKASGDDVAGFLPNDLVRAIRRWYHGNGGTGAVGIVSQSPALDVIPWERVPSAIALLNLAIVRLLTGGHTEPSIDGAARALLVAGWSGAPFVDMPGIEKEMAALGVFGANEGIPVRVIAEPTVEEFIEAWTSERPPCVHIASPAVVYESSGAKLAVSGVDKLELVALDDILAKLGGVNPSLVFFNLCSGAFGAPSAARLTTERLNVTTVSWYGTVEDMEAADFASFFYARLADGDTALRAVTAFNGIRLASTPIQQNKMLTVSGLPAMPVIWSPTIDALDVAPLASGQTRRDSSRRSRGASALEPIATSRTEPAHVSVEFEPQRWLNPALLKNQFPALNRLVLTADQPMRNVGVTITCDAGVGRSTVSLTKDLVRGSQPVDEVQDLRFPVLYQLIESSTVRRWVNFTVRCRQGDEVLSETTRSALWMGTAEWLDRKDMWHFIPAFVNPNAKEVLAVVGAATDLLTADNPTYAFDGYQRNDRGYVTRQCQAIFNCLRRDYHLAYIDVPPLRVYLPDEAVPSGQRVRSPDNVIEDHRGTCHDLAILFASLLEQIGIKPLIVLAPSHTYLGYWTSEDAWYAFWARTEDDAVRLSQVSGRNWIIAAFDEMAELVDSGKIALVEATRVTNANATFEEALELGREKFNPRQGFDVAIDVVASRQRVQPV